MPVSNYTTKTTGKVRRLVDFECPNCGYIENDRFEDEEIFCHICARFHEKKDNGIQIWWSAQMIAKFSPKNNAQRAYVRDERRD